MVMPYRVVFTSKSEEDLIKLDKLFTERILGKIRWLSENFDAITPEALTGEYKGLLKIRSGDYRVLYSVHTNTRVITIHRIGHRRNVYQQK